MNKIKVFKLNENATVPTRTKETDAGLDIYALKDVFIPLGNTALIPTGIAIKIEPGYIGKIEDRSSMAIKGLRTGAGVVDAGYSGEVGIVLHNFNAVNSLAPHGDYPNHFEVSGYQIKKGDKIAQIVIYAVETPEVEVVNELWTSDRGANGFGSSGV